MRKEMTRENKIRVLLLGGGTQALIVSKKLYEAGREVHIFDEGRWTYSYHTRYAHKKIIVPSALFDEKYLDFLQNYIKENNIDCLFPMNDEAARFLSVHKYQLCALAKFIIPDIDIFEMGYNKNSLMMLCAKINAPHPKSVDLERDIERVDTLSYPAVIKPNHMTGGRGMQLVSSAQECKMLYPKIKNDFGACHVQEFIPSGGRQIKVQVFIHKGELYASSVIHKQRFYPENGGSSCCCKSIEDKSLVEECTRVLKYLGWEGFADFDLIEDPRDGIVKIMEINPRVPACLQAVVDAGVDYANMIVDASLGKTLCEYKYVPGNSLRHIGFEILWFIYSKNRFSTTPNWFDFFSKRLSFQDFRWSDPLPFLFGTMGNILKIMNPNFRKAKSGLR